MTISDKMLRALRSAIRKMGEDVPCPECGAMVHRPFGSESVCGPHGHKVPATAPVLLFKANPLVKFPMIIIEHVDKAAQ